MCGKAGRDKAYRPGDDGERVRREFSPAVKTRVILTCTDVPSGTVWPVVGRVSDFALYFPRVPKDATWHTWTERLKSCCFSPKDAKLAKDATHTSRAFGPLRRGEQVELVLMLLSVFDEVPLVIELTAVGERERVEDGPTCFTDAERVLQQLDQRLRRKRSRSRRVCGSAS